MLRVITKRKGTTYRLEMHGMLGGPWVPVLEEHWRSIVEGHPSGKVEVVLSNVEFIDPDGERLIARMAGAGVKFVVSGCMNRYVVEKLKPHGGETKGARL